jgi:hypothetical protein
MKRALLLLLIVLCGCDELADAISTLDATDPCTGDTAQVQGTWAIRGEGARKDCSDKRLRTEGFTLESEALRVVQDGELLALSGVNGVAGVAFKLRDARVQGTCVRFATVEGGGEDEIVYEFEGRAIGLGKVEGSFTGSGPGDCTSRGHFSVSIR